MASSHRFSASSLIHFLLFISHHRNPPVEAVRPFPAAATYPPATAKSTEFIRKSCSSATYPSLCFSSLSSYASAINNSPTLLAHTALSISLDDSRAAAAKLWEISAAQMSWRVAGAMRDCVENVGDAIDELRQSMSELAHLWQVKADVGFKINNIQTWVSAALTDEYTCMDAFAGRAMDGGVKTAVRARVANLAHLTSNALFLVNGLASSHNPP